MSASDHEPADPAAQLAADNAALGPALPGYHWASVAHDRGWEQPRLDGGNGAQLDGFCSADHDLGRDVLADATHRQRRHEITATTSPEGAGPRR